MPTLDEELLDQQVEPEQAEPSQDDVDQYISRQEAFEARQQQQKRQQQLTSKAQSAVNTVQQAQKWYKRYKKTVIVLQFLAGTSPIWGTLLLTLFIIITFVGGCNSSLTFRALSLGTCEPFIISGQTENIQSQTTTGPATGGSADDATNRAYLLANGISVNNPYPKTSLAGMLQTTLGELVAFKLSCENSTGKTCAVKVTGGTEDAHAEGLCSHSNGYKADIAPNAGIDQYITSSGQFTDSGLRSDGAHMYTEKSSGAVYARESNHWDIVVGCTTNA